MPGVKTETASFFPQLRFAESRNWPLQTFTLTENRGKRAKIGRTIIGIGKCDGSDRGCKVYVTTDVGVQILSQRELERKKLVKDSPVSPGEKRVTRARYLSLEFPRIWIGNELEVDFTGKENGVVSLYAASPKKDDLVEDIKFAGSFNDYPV